MYSFFSIFLNILYTVLTLTLSQQDRRIFIEACKFLEHFFLNLVVYLKDDSFFPESPVKQEILGSLSGK